MKTNRFAPAIAALLASAAVATAAPAGADPVRLADEPGRAPYQKSASDSKVGTESANANFGAIPAGSRLVIEHVAISTLQSATEQPVQCSLVVQDSASGVTLIPLDAPKALTPLRKVVSQKISAYADGQVFIGCLKLEGSAGNAGLLTISAVITGHYVAK